MKLSSKCCRSFTKSGNSRDHFNSISLKFSNKMGNRHNLRQLENLKNSSKILLLITIETAPVVLDLAQGSIFIIICRKRHESNRTDSLDSSDSSDSSSREQNEHVKRTLAMEITHAVQLYHNALVKNGRLIGKP